MVLMVELPLVLALPWMCLLPWQLKNTIGAIAQETDTAGRVLTPLRE